MLCNIVNAQLVIAEELYQGTINGELKISLYLKMQETGCPSTIVNAIYKYDNNKTNNWILLDVIFSENNNWYTLVEHYNTGVLLLKKEVSGFDKPALKKIKILYKCYKIFCCFDKKIIDFFL